MPQVPRLPWFDLVAASPADGLSGCHDGVELFAESSVRRVVPALGAGAALAVRLALAVIAAAAPVRGQLQAVGAGYADARPWSVHESPFKWALAR
ncbi:hypothetical protein [Mycobacterium sp.]|uniref:hypothetical protein n=1 Tax=Mycobacterium sp. TaxID=1785 RepID=UPI003F98B9CC